MAQRVQQGSKLPNATFKYYDHEGHIRDISVEELCKDKRAILFGVPGAFTPTCSSKHVPTFIDKADQLKAKGVDVIGCIGVNDVFVMKAWGEQLGVGDKVMLLADGNGEFTKSAGLDSDMSHKGLGVRCLRYAMIVDDMVVKVLNIESEESQFQVSGADNMLEAIDKLKLTSRAVA